MSASIIKTANLVSHQFTIYVGIPVFFLGVIGDLLNFLVFISLKTFRQSSCAFYLIITSMVDVGFLVTGLLTFIMVYGFGIDWTIQSRSYCIFREGFVHICMLTGFTCLSLATIDHFLATCTSFKCRELCNIKLARSLCAFVVICWSLYATLFFVSYDLIRDPSTGALECIVISNVFEEYFQTFHVLILLGALPISVTVTFGCLAYRNVQQLSYRALPLVRRELDKQLTVMVLVHVFFNFIAMTPYTIINAIILDPKIMSDPVKNSVISSARIVSIVLLYGCFACPFYIYICASERFRKQLFYVLFKVHLQRWHHRNAVIDLVIPQH